MKKTRTINILLIFLISLGLIISGCSKDNSDTASNENNIGDTEQQDENNQGIENDDNNQLNQDEENDKDEQKGEIKNSETDNFDIINTDYLLDYLGKSREEILNDFGQPDMDEYDFMYYETSEGYAFKFITNLETEIIEKVSIESNGKTDKKIELYDIGLGSGDLQGLEGRFDDPPIIEETEFGYDKYTYQDGDKYIIECHVPEDDIIALISITALDLDKNIGDNDYDDEQNQYYSLDSDILYHYMDGDADFLLMKLGDLPLKESDEGKYYEVDYNEGYATWYWLAEDDFTINKISVIKNLDYYSQEGNIGLSSQRFMGIWFDMTLEEATKNVTNIPTWNSDSFDLRVEYSDYEGDGMVYKIDVYTNKDISINEYKEDFYLKWLGANMELEANHLGSGNFDSKEPLVEEGVFIYDMEYGPDKWQKSYFHDDNLTITGMRISTALGNEFKANVPSLLGVRLNMQLDNINKGIESANSKIIREESYDSDEGEFLTKEYTIVTNDTNVFYNIDVNVHKSNNLVASIEASHKPMIEQKEDYSVKLIGQNISKLDELEKGKYSSESPIVDNSNGMYRYEMTGNSDKWIKEYYYDDDIIKKVVLRLGSDKPLMNTYPSIMGIKLNTDLRIIENSFMLAGYSIGNSDIFDADDNKYTVYKYMIYGEDSIAHNISIYANTITGLIEKIEVYEWQP
ncbi:hypothetical protein [Sporosalibacterium faouarense]|uniref:hypothetical protein n=1 Tax=Sporosalibacterium faouarense TaxID=516123 RepID=UPI00192B34C8|nr:hypothetical protein [Sporosalibacterium faouarense]